MGGEVAADEREEGAGVGDEGGGRRDGWGGGTGVEVTVGKGVGGLREGAER